MLDVAVFLPSRVRAEALAGTTPILAAGAGPAGGPLRRLWAEILHARHDDAEYLACLLLA